jgi:cysteine-rich repeat protein
MHQFSKIAAMLCLALNASGALAEKSKGAEKLLADTAGKAQISVDENTGFARFIRLTPNSQLGPVRLQTRSSVGNTRGSSKVNNVSTSLSFLRTYGSAFGITDVDTELTLVGTKQDKLGSEHSVFKQFYKGLPVFAGELRTHFNSNGEMIAVNGKFVSDIKVVTKPVITVAQATVIAFRKVEQDPTKAISSDSLGNREDKLGTPAALLANTSTLMIFRSGIVKGTPGQDHLVYEIEVINGIGNVREFVYVDAINGKVVDQITGIYDALDRRAFDAESAAHPGPNYPANPYWVEGDILPTGLTEADNMIYASADTYSLFDNAFGRDSFDDAGATMDAIFNRGDSCPNASWNGTYISFCPGLTSDDVTAHEWAHAYTQYTNNLIYQWQSGALNESYSDIWGDTIDRINGRDDFEFPDVARTDGSCSTFGQGTPSVDNSVRWLMGEDTSGFGGAIRDMWNPTCYGDPGKVTDNEYYCLTTDSGGVHSNSGVPNHAYALMVDGGIYNGFSDSGLGLTKSAHIHWAAQNMLTPSSNFYDHADALEASCAALTGVPLPDLIDGSDTGEAITTSDCAQVSAIIDAVEFRTSPTQCGFEPLLAEAPALCEGMGNVESFFSEDFENGALPTGWTVSSRDVADPATFDSPGWMVVDDLPPGANGDFAAFAPNLIAGNCVADTEAGAVNIDSPVIVLPASPTPHVAFNHWVSTEATWDGGNLKMSVNGGAFVVVPGSAYSFNPYNGVLSASDNPMGTEEAFTGNDGGSLSGSWGQSQVDLIGLASAGDTIQLRFELGTDGCNGSTGWYVESVEGYACSAEVAPVCGDSQLDLGEMCDDGNSANGDGCSASCEVESGFNCSLPINGTNSSNIVADWSFEGGVPNEDWLASSTFTGINEFPLCGPGNGCPALPTVSGSWVVWIGGLPTGVTSSVAQEITIPAAATELTLNVLRGVCDTGPTPDSIQISIDGEDIGTVVCDATDSNYVEQSFSVEGFNDGGVHTLQIGGTVGGFTQQSNFFVDDVTIEDNTPVPATPSICLPVVTDIVCNVEPVGFDDGIAPSWTVVDNAGLGIVWSSVAVSGIGGNFTGGSGDAASVSSDAAPGDFDTELHSNTFSLVGFTGATLEYVVDYQNYGFLDFLNLDVSTDGGSTWANLLTWNEDHPVGGLLNATGEAVSVDLTHYAGEADVTLRWHYMDPNSNDWDWYAQIDDVSLSCDNVPKPLKCDINLDGIVDGNDINIINASRYQAAPAGDPRDNNGDGIITMSDARQCMQLCTLPRCATPQP